MRKFFLISIVSLFFLPQLLAQDFYWVAFTDKANSAFSINNPDDFLSERAIQRRIKQNILIDTLDLPVNKNYIDSILSLGVSLVHQSKWLNGITVKVEIDSFQIKAAELSFVKEIQLTKPSSITKSVVNKFYEPDKTVQEPTSDYGESVSQIEQLNGQYLHDQNFKGQGMVIAIIDGGFSDADLFIAFDSLWANNQILGTRDFVDPTSNIFDTNYHGMSVLSCIGGNVPGQLIGTAPKANFWLLRSEDTNTEFIIEEDHWIVAAEFADSVGADVINSSLGYYQFNDAGTDHSYADMDGKTTRVTKGANIAASRGMLIFSSAGNEGNKTWKYIIAPSDGDSVIGVGAVDKNGIPAYFSSYGPASDGDVKPNIVAIGRNTYLQNSSGELGYSNGTSFSSPVMAGMATCLWQANPDVSAMQIKSALEQSAHKYNNPDSLSGYGIPDFKLADQSLKSMAVKQFQSENKWSIYPNPFTDNIVLQKKGTPINSEIKIELFSTKGRMIEKWFKTGASKMVLNNFPDLPAGLLLLRITENDYAETIKLSKTR